MNEESLEEIKFYCIVKSYIPGILALDRDWLKIGDFIYLGDTPIKIVTDGTKDANNVCYYKTNTQMMFHPGQSFTNIPPKSLEYKIRDYLRAKEISFSIEVKWKDHTELEWYSETTEDHMVQTIKEFIENEFSECTKSTVSNKTS